MSPSTPRPATATGGRARSTADGTPPKGLGREFGKLWTASTTSAIGDGISLTAAPLMASTLTDDPRLIAGVTMALTLPFALFGLPAGVLVDRLDLRRAMMRIDYLRGTAVTLFALSVAFGWAHLYTLYLCFFLIGTCETFFRNASQIVVPSVVPGALLVEANGRLLGAQTAANQFVGPLVGSALFAVVTGAPFAVDAATFFVSATLLLTLRTTASPATAVRTGAAAARPGLLADMTTGARWLLRHRLLRNLAFIAGTINLVVTGGMAVLVVHAHTVLRIGDFGYGLLLACQAVGAVLASRVSATLARRIGSERALVCVALALAVGNTVVWLVPSAWAVGAALALTACAGVTWDVVVVVLRQTLIPKELQGRVNSVYRLLAWGAMPVGAGLAGLGAKALGTSAVFGLGAAVMAVVTVRLVLAARVNWISAAGAES
ncbi:MFS transporter [Streptantibioticus silvisoli]|uniref:MFS transporter n=1 Tax=Streptantibioticus silvisoli TaxID=2705255 RepID=A0ABT6W1D0_9ACTN|nr:MFS transporter [Streptantibioticus silvisoli]MDI5964535.1 MFS transporter [Streptantibioticus silvisoli]